MRIFHHRHLDGDVSKLIFNAFASRPVSVLAAVSGILMLALVPFIDASGKLPPVAAPMIAFPATGLLIAGFLLLLYKTETVICPGSGQVTFTERLAGLPLRTLKWDTGRFDDIIPSVTGSGREARRDHYTVVTLTGVSRLPLLDVESYREAVKLCEEMKAKVFDRSQAINPDKI